MYRKTSPEVKGRILALSAQKFSAFMIRKELLKSNIDVLKRTINYVLERSSKPSGKKCVRDGVSKKRKPSEIRISNAIRRIRDYSKKDNPMVQREMGRRTKVSQSTVHRIIDKKVDRKRIKKLKVHRLSDAMIAKRRIRAKPFAELVAGKKAEFILTLDEAKLPLNFLNGHTTHSYQPKKKSERIKNQPVATSAPQYPRSIMFAAGMTWRGPTDFYHIPENSKMNSENFCDSVLEPMFTKDIPRLYGRDAKKVVLHMDSASSHTSRDTYNWLNQRKIKYITNEQWLPNSPKASPMDYFGNGYFKSQMAKRQYSTMRGMLAAAKQEWSKVSPAMCRNALSSWSSRVLAIHKARGHDVPS